MWRPDGGHSRDSGGVRNSAAWQIAQVGRQLDHRTPGNLVGKSISQEHELCMAEINRQLNFLNLQVLKMQIGSLKLKRTQKINSRPDTAEEIMNCHGVLRN